MPPTVINDVYIADIIYDRMVIEVYNPLYQGKVLQYAITNQNNQILRKGSFTGSSVQLWIAHLQEGKYGFSISSEGMDFQRSFEKRPRM